MNHPLLKVVGVFVLLSLGSSSAGADELILDAKTLFARGVTQHLQLSADGAEIRLGRGVLFEDDGPAAGYSYRPNAEKLISEVRVKKQLIVSTPQAQRATLLVGGRGNFSAWINGKSAQLEATGKQGNYWQAYLFPPAMLRKGANEFVLSGSGSLWIARDDEYSTGSLMRTKHPNRSAKSLDAGKTWSDSKLGANDDIDGEYCVRLFLDQHQPHGKLTLGVVDVGNLAEQSIGPPVTSVGPIRIRAKSSSGRSSSLQLRQRTGTTFVPNASDWSKWTTVQLDDDRIAKPVGRYLQLAIEFQTDDPLETPALASVSISASPQRPRDWTKGLQIVKLENPPIVRSSIPFKYEPFDRPELAKLRRDYRLDDVVASVTSEFELIERLAVWSASRWQGMHLKESYPAYNALEILAPHDDGTPVGGFCQQFNVVFLQACQSFGLVGRLVSIGPGNMVGKIRSGHEAVEIWSNEFGKWIYIDGNTAWYAVDQETKQPLSLFELRERQLAAFRSEDYPPVKVIELAKTKYQWSTLQSWPAFVELRLIPRSNFLEQKSPLPLNQGMRGWFWTGHYVWDDEKAPARPLYSSRVTKRANLQWTLNQAHLTFEAMKPGTLRVHVDTETPGFRKFLRQTDRGPATTDAVFQWHLKPGMNRLQVAPQNVAGRSGIAAVAELRWNQP